MRWTHVWLIGLMISAAAGLGAASGQTSAHLTADQGTYQNCPDDNETHVHVSLSWPPWSCVSGPLPTIHDICEIAGCGNQESPEVDPSLVFPPGPG